MLYSVMNIKNLPYNQETVRSVTNSKIVRCSQDLDSMRERALKKRQGEMDMIWVTGAVTRSSPITLTHTHIQNEESKHKWAAETMCYLHCSHRTFTRPP